MAEFFALPPRRPPPVRRRQVPPPAGRASGGSGTRKALKHSTRIDTGQTARTSQGGLGNRGRQSVRQSWVVGRWGIASCPLAFSLPVRLALPVAPWPLASLWYQSLR